MLWLDHVVLLCLSRFHSLVSEVFLVHFSFPLVFICLPYILAMCAASRWVRDLSLDFFSCLSPPARCLGRINLQSLSFFICLQDMDWMPLVDGFSSQVSPCWSPSLLLFSFHLLSFHLSRVEDRKTYRKKCDIGYIYMILYDIYIYLYTIYIYIWYLAWSKLFLNL